jgi:16S rRNA (adenine1518-N6/adenine1519-N6)-dimethyltransferase
MQKHGAKLLGQHFTRCSWVVSAMIGAADIGPEDTVIEVGAGKGALTRELAKKAKRVIAVEKDNRLAEDYLQSEAGDNLEIVPGDILSVYGVLAANKKNSPFKIMGAIPYYLTSRLIRLILEFPQKPKIAVLTVQKEVAHRMTERAPRGNLLALAAETRTDVEVIRDVPARCFSPPPKVDSSIVRLSNISDAFFLQNSIHEKGFFDLLRACFSQRRKTLGNSLGTYLKDKKTAIALLAESGVGASARPEELPLHDWVRIYKRAAIHLSLHPKNISSFP